MLGSLATYIAQFRAGAIATHVGHYKVERAALPTPGQGRSFDQFPKTLVYEGPGKIESYEPHETALNTAGKTVVAQRYTWHVDLDQGPFQIGDIVTLVGSVAGMPVPGAIGTSYRIAGLLDKEIKRNQRFLVDALVIKPVTASGGAPPGQGSDG